MDRKGEELGPRDAAALGGAFSEFLQFLEDEHSARSPPLASTCARGPRPRTGSWVGLDRGDPVHVFGRFRNWYAIELGGVTGFIYRDHVDLG